MAERNLSFPATSDTDGWDEDGLGDLEPLDGTGELAMIIYFGFDLSDIRAEDQAMLERHAINLAIFRYHAIDKPAHARQIERIRTGDRYLRTGCFQLFNS